MNWKEENEKMKAWKEANPNAGYEGWILDSGGDAYFRMHSLREFIQRENPKKKPTPRPEQKD
jgi:hypothetical protein